MVSSEPFQLLKPDINILYATEGGINAPLRQWNDAEFKEILRVLSDGAWYNTNL